MRPKKSDKLLDKELAAKSAVQVLSDFLKICETNSKETTSINLKIECMTNLLNSIKSIFSSHVGNKFEEDQIKFEQDLHNNSKLISFTLISCLIQVDSNIIRLLSLRILLYITHFKKIHLQLQNFNINMYIVRIIDLDFSVDDTALAVEYIRLIIQLYPMCLDESIMYCLLASLEDKNYRLNNLILETILEITCIKPKLACKCQVFTDLINYIVNVNSEEEFCIEVIMQSLIKVIDKQEYRDCIRFDDLFRNLIAPFVDYEYVPFLSEYSNHKTKNKSENSGNFLDNQYADKFNLKEPNINEILSSCSCALLTLLNSYPGVMCMGANDCQLIRDLISPLSWFLKSNKRDYLEKELNQISASCSFQSYRAGFVSSKKLTQIQQIIASQINILNHLIDFLYKLVILIFYY
jgi:hypothetical protein